MSSYTYSVFADVEKKSEKSKSLPIVEVCCDSYASVVNAIEGGARRIDIIKSANTRTKWDTLNFGNSILFELCIAWGARSTHTREVLAVLV